MSLISFINQWRPGGRCDWDRRHHGRRRSRRRNRRRHGCHHRLLGGWGKETL